MGVKTLIVQRTILLYETFPLVSSKVLLDTLKSFELNLLEFIYMYHELKSATT